MSRKSSRTTRQASEAYNRTAVTRDGIGGVSGEEESRPKETHADGTDVMKPIEGLFLDPAEGLPLKHALTFFLDDPPMTDAHGVNLSRYIQRIRLLPKSRLSQLDIDRGKNAEFIFSTRLIWWLSAGKLYATAFQPNSLVRVTVPKEYWTKVELDLEESAARANGIAITGVLVFEAGPPAVESNRPALAQVEPVPPSPAAKPPVAKARLREWYSKRVRNWPDGKKSPESDADFKDAKRHFVGNAVTRSAVRALRRELAPAEWQAKGRPNTVTGKSRRKSRREISPKNALA